MSIQGEQTSSITPSAQSRPEGFDLRPPVLEDADLAGTLTLRIPDPLECIPRRARRVGGRRHYHPSVSIIEEGPIAEPTDWGIGSVISHQPAPAVTFHNVASTFDFFSVKTRRTVYGTGPHEFAHGKELEVNPWAVDFELQGVRILWNSDERDHYTGDSVALMVDHVVAAEVKASQSYFEHPDYDTVMWNAQRSFEAAGLRFRKVTGDEMAGRRRRRWNIDRAFDDRATAFDKRESDALAILLHSGCGSVPMGRLVVALSPHRSVGRQIVNAMLCQRHLAYDLDGIVDDDTEVTAPPQALDHTDIRQIGL